MRSLVCFALVYQLLDRALRNTNCLTAPFCSVLQWVLFWCEDRQTLQALSSVLAEFMENGKEIVYVEKTKALFLRWEMKRQAAQNIRFSHPHECPT